MHQNSDAQIADRVRSAPLKTPNAFDSDAMWHGTGHRRHATTSDKKLRFFDRRLQISDSKDYICSKS